MADAARSPVIPCLRYRDAPAAIAWLVRVLGFAEHAVHPHPDGTIAHAQLTLGGGMVMLGSAVDSEYGRYVTQPDAVGGLSTQGSYVLVPDADAVHARVVSSGAEVVLPLKNEDFGGRGFTCRDPEGHLWSVGTYDPWASS